MQLRAWIFTLLLILLLNLPLHEPIVQKDPWLELEKGLRLCGVETITYQIHCFISESEKERIVSAGVAPLKKEVTDLSDCCWSMQEGYENGEILINPIYRFEEDEKSTLEKVSGKLMRTKNPFKNDYKLRIAGINEVI